jgi:hypothetical protein
MIVVVVVPALPQTAAEAPLRLAVANADVIVRSAFIFATRVLEVTSLAIATVISPSNPTLNRPEQLPPPEGHVHTRF